MIPFLSVVVPTCERDDHLAECLRRLAPGAQTLPAEQYEVIVTDDGSRSTAAALLQSQFPWACWAEGPRRGPAANRNRGASTSQGRWIVFCDDDVLPAPDFLRAYVNAIQEHREVLVFEGKTSADRPKQHPLEGAPINEAGGQLWSCNLAVSAEYFRKLGGFNEQFPYAAMEDLDFKRRVVDSRAPTLFVPGAEIVHPWRMLDLKKHTRRHVASQLIYARLHPDEQHLFSFTTHLKNIARYYIHDFPSEVRVFGWEALRCQPVRWWEMAYRGWHLLLQRSAP